MQDSGIDIGDITARKALRKQLQCKTFRWYLVSVYPEMRMYSDIIAYGVVRSQRSGFRSVTDRTRKGGRSLSACPVGPAVDLRPVSGAVCEAAFVFIAQTSPLP